jgi:hypothetical protein
MFDAGYIYFMFSPRSFLYKIGKGKDFKRRKRQIDDSVPGELKCLFKVYLIGISGYEKELHRIYDNYRTTWKGLGKTEYFKLSPIGAMTVIFRMVQYQLGQILIFLIIICILFAFVQ